MYIILERPLVTKLRSKWYYSKISEVVEFCDSIFTLGKVLPQEHYQNVGLQPLVTPSFKG